MQATQMVSILDEVLDFLTSAPTPQQIIAFHASEAAQERLRYLLFRNRNDLLTSDESEELEQASQLDHFVAKLKIKAREKLMKNDIHP